MLNGDEHTLPEYLRALDEAIDLYPNRHMRELRAAFHFALQELRK